MSQMSEDTGFSTLGFLDKVLETGTSLYGKVLDAKTAKNNAAANEALAAMESSRLSLYQTLSKNTEIAGVSVPNWLVPVTVIGAGVLYFFKKK